MDGKLYQTVRYDFPEPDQIYRRAHRADVDYLRRYLYEHIRKVGSIGWKTIVFYMATTACAVVIGLIFANIFKGSFGVLQTSGLEYEAADPVNFMDTLVNIFPSNIIQPMAEATMLQVIVIALFFGFGMQSWPVKKLRRWPVR